jgi:hypothetical protein
MLKHLKVYRSKLYRWCNGYHARIEYECSNPQMTMIYEYTCMFSENKMLVTCTSI